MLTGTPHFPLAEVTRNTEGPIPERYQDDAQETLETLERIRAVLRVKLKLTSLWRSPAANAQLPGSVATSGHLAARAADFVPVGISLALAAERWANAVADGTAPELHQFLVEVAGEDGLGAHVHISLGTGQQTIARLADGTYTTLRDWIAGASAAVSATAQRAATGAGAEIAGSPRRAALIALALAGALGVGIIARRPRPA